MQYLIEFKRAVEKRQKANKITADFIEGSFSINNNKVLFGDNIPQAVKAMFSVFNGLIISEPRHFELLKHSELIVLDERYLHFATMNSSERICFDMREINSAGEWDIINYNEGFIITKTIASYLTNKIWAWIDRERTIWKEETYA